MARIENSSFAGLPTSGRISDLPCKIFLDDDATWWTMQGMAQAKYSVYVSQIQNKDQEPFGNIQGAKEKIELRATYCQSVKCVGTAYSSRGRMVHVGSYLKECPDCGSSNLYFDTCTKFASEKFKETNTMRKIQRKKK